MTERRVYDLVGRPTVGEGETIIVTQRVTDPYTAEHVLSVGSKLCLVSGETYETASEGAPHISRSCEG
jgi:hypothetical protein